MQIITFFLSLLWIISKSGVTITSSTLTVKEKRVTALVLARGGSKGIPLKNLAKIDGISLLGRTLMAANEAYVFHDIWVSTDHAKIANEAEKYKAKVFHRSSEFSQDNSSSIAAVQEFIKHHSAVNYIALLQCTSPFQNPKYLKEIFKVLDTRDCVFSVTRSYKLRWQQTKTHIKPVNFNITRRPRRQDWDGELIETGMFYLASRKLLEQGLFQNKNCDVIEIDPIDSIEIDSPNDLLVAEAILKSKTNKSF